MLFPDFLACCPTFIPCCFFSDTKIDKRMALALTSSVVDSLTDSEHVDESKNLLTFSILKSI